MGPKPPMKKSLLNKKNTTLASSSTTPVPPPPSTAVTIDDTMTWLRDGPLPPNWTRFSSRDVVVERIFRLNDICLKSNHGNIQLPNALDFLTKEKHISNYVQPGVFAFVNLTRLFYASLRVSSDGKTISGFIGKFSFSFTEEDIVHLYDKDKSFVDTAPALFTAEFLDSISSTEDLHQSLFIIPNKKPHALVSHRHFLLYMIIHSNILPSKGNTTEMTQKMIALLSIIDNHNPCLAHIIFHNLKGVLGNKKPVVLPYPCMIASLLRAKGFIFPEFHETTLHIDVVDNRVWDRCLGSGAETRMDAFTRKNMKFTDGLVVGAPTLPDTHPLVSSKRRRTLVGGSSPGSSSSAGPNNAAFSRFESSIATLTNLVTNMGLSVNARFDTLDEKVLAIQQESNARFDVLEDKIQNVQSSMDALSRNCLKAYHHECVGKVENELEPEKRWHCSWHTCLVCNRRSAFRCYGCPSAVCKGCIDYAEFVHVRNKKGFCANCLRLALLIEENVDVDSDGEKIDFKDRNTFETLFKEYWEIVKETEGLTLENLHSADIKLKKGLSSKNGSDSDKFDEGEEDRDFVDNMDGILDFETCSFMGKELKIFSSGKRSRKVKPKRREFDGWGSKSLRDFLKSIGKDSNDPISQNEVNAIIQKYIQENKLIHPEKKKKILCDTKLQSIFSRKSVNRNKTYDLLERHFTENLEQSDENEWSYSSDEMVEGSAMSCKKQRKTSLSKSIDEKLKVTETRRSCFASVTAQNIKLVYLKRSLIEEFLKNPVSFDEKVTECFVRVKSDPNDYFQKNAYQLLQVKGITKVPGNDIKEEVTLHVSNSKKTFRIGMLSDEDFSEEEIEDLHQRVKDGLLQKLSIVDLERKAHSLHEDLTKHWIKRELVRLQNLSDRANEKGWRRELFEYMERMQLLQTPAEQQRLIQEVPKVIAEEIEVEVTTPLDLPIDENPVKENSPRSILLPMDSVGTSNITGNEDAGCVNADIKVTSDLPMMAAKGDDTDSKSAKKVQDFSWVEVKRSYLDERPVERVTEGAGIMDPICVNTAMTALPDLSATVVNGDCIDFRGTGKTEDFELTVRGFVQNENAAYAYSLVPRLAGNQDQKMDTADGRASEKEIEGPHLSVQVKVESSKDAQLVVLDDNKGGQGGIKQNAPTGELIDLDNDSDETPESKIWHYMDPYGATHGPFPLLKLKEWWDEGHFTVVPDFKVWKVGQGKEEAVLLDDVLRQSFPGYRKG